MSVEFSVTGLRQIADSYPRWDAPWETQPYFDPPAPAEAIDAFESAVGFPLPPDLRTFFGLTEAVVGMSIHNGYWIGGLDCLTHSAGSGDFPREIAGVPVALVGTDGGGNGFLIASTGEVWRCDHETRRMKQVAPTFAAFLERVVQDWEAFTDNVAGWPYLV